MKNLLIFAGLWISSVTCYSIENCIWYVSPSGNDSFKGTLASLLKPIRAALVKARESDSGQKTEIMLRAGMYEQTAILEVNRGNILIHPYQYEKVIISGGKQIAGNHTKIHCGKVFVIFMNRVFAIALQLLIMTMVSVGQRYMEIL